MIAPLLDGDLRFLQAEEDLLVQTLVTKLCCDMPASRHATGAALPCDINTSMNNDLLRAKPLFRHPQAPLPSPFSHTAWSKKARSGQRNVVASSYNSLSTGDKISLGNSANSGLVAGFREISVGVGVRGGAERTRTACQARSRYRTGLSRVIRRGNSAIKCR